MLITYVCRLIFHPHRNCVLYQDGNLTTFCPRLLSAVRAEPELLQVISTRIRATQSNENASHVGNAKRNR